MRYNYLILLFLLIAGGCKDSNPLVYKASVDVNVVRLSFEQDTATILLKTNYKWSVTNIPNWLTVSPDKGEEGTERISLSCTYNGSDEERTAELYLQAGEAGQPISVIQMRKGVLAFCIPDTIVYEQAATIYVSVHSNLEYDLVYPAECKWITTERISPDDWAIRVASMTNEDIREVPLVLYAEGCTLSDTLYLTQMTKLRHTRQILEHFYYAMNGDEWYYNTNWLSDLPFKDWYGLYDVDGDLVQVFLTDNNLTGEIPDDFYDLVDLERLVIRNNPLSGTISPKIGNFRNLTELDLGYNGLSGKLPDEIWSLSGLESLVLSENSFQPITIDYSNLGNLKNLDMGSLYVTNPLSPGIKKLQNLEWLRFSNLQAYDTLPWELFELKKLHSLMMYECSFTGPIPLQIGNLKELTFLNISGNLLTGEVPEEIGLLKKLTGLYISGNYLTGEIPAALLLLPHWNEFDLRGILSQREGKSLTLPNQPPEL